MWWSARVVASTLAVATSCLGAGCDGEARGDLHVDVRTDLRPGHELAEVRVQLVGARAEAMASVRVPVERGEDEAFLAGRRVAEFPAVVPSDVAVRVALLDDLGRTLLERMASVRVGGRDRVVTVVLTRDCRDTSCPAAGADAAATQCLSGQCVPESCHPENPSSCPPPQCTTDGDCPATAACSIGRCVEGVCLQSGQDSRCGAAEWCSPDLGCLSLSPGSDGGTDGGSDAGQEGGVADAGVDSGTPDGSGVDGWSIVCGDGRVDPGEVCDDGNTDSGDGCSASCRLEGDSCFDPIDLALMGTMPGDGTVRYVGSLARAHNDVRGEMCANSDTVERTFVWTTPAEGVLHATTMSPTTEFRPVLHARTACADEATHLACADAAYDDLYASVTSGSSVYLFVEQRISYECCTFELIVRVRPYLESGDACDPSSQGDVCRPGLTCTATGMDGGTGYTCA